MKRVQAARIARALLPLNLPRPEPEPEHTQDPDGDWPRVGGDVVCDQCGKTFYRHPLDGPDGFDGKFLNRLCSGQLVKL